MQPEIERRAVVGVEVRAATVADAAPTIVGYAAVFNSPSEDLGGFREVIMPGAFDRALREGHDVRALVDHESGKILGRTKSGTLSLTVDERGLRAEINPPDTQVARDAMTSLKRGDLDGMSFAFRTLSDAWLTQDGQEVRQLLDLELVDVSIVAYPAYSATSVAARALERAAAAHRKCEICGAHYYDPENRGHCAPGVAREINEARLKLARG